MLRIVGDVHPVWGWNQDMENPTFTPSILVNGNVEFVNPTAPRCHTFVTDGWIDYLTDCTHGMKGTKVRLPDWERYNEAL